MKKIIVGLLVILAVTWLYFSHLNYSGLSSAQELANYHEGILSLKELPQSREVLLQNAGFESQVHIDTLGIPHIFGKDPDAVAYSMGYMHARDRYFQMELIANTVKGELSSIIGEPGINSDRRWIKYELGNKAKLYLDSLQKKSPALFNYLVSYTKGINDYISNEDKVNRDPMYAIWNYSPHQWDVANVFLIQWYMSSQLAMYDDYVDRQEILDKIPASIRQILYPDQPFSEPYIIPGKKMIQIDPEVKSPVVKLFGPNQSNTYIGQEFDRSLGSNNWVINSSRTKSGELFLCNDLHLFLTSPNIFYELQGGSPGMHVYGFTIPGVPLILTGHNEKISWGITNGGWDVTEQYLLRVNPKNQEQYWLDGKWQDMTKKNFTIHVKGGKDEQATTRFTVFGPASKNDTLFYATRWYPVQSCDALESFWQLMHAGDWDGFRAALRAYDYPSQNFAYADVMGNIGMVCAGKMPAKPAGYSGGLLDGTKTTAYSFISFDSLPQVLNPAQGYLFSANQQPLQSTTYYSSRWFDDLYRPRRINEMLAGNTAFDLESIRNMQLDVKDLSANDVATILNKYFPDKRFSPNWESLRNWDGMLTTGSEQALFFKFFRRAAGAVRNDMTKSLAVKAGPLYDQFMNFLLSNSSFSFAGKNYDSKECFEKIIRIADSLYADSRGGSMKNPFGFSIPNMTFLPGLGVDVDDMGGNENTINVNYSAHSVIRTLISIKGNMVQSWMVNAIGQTGRLNNRNYFQQLSSWKKNNLHKTQFTTSPEKLQYISENIIFSK